MRIHEILNETAYSTDSFDKKFGNNIYRGLQQDFDEKFFKFKYREAPRDSLKVIFHYINELTNKKFGIPIRSLMFATPNAKEASRYGKIYTVHLCDGYRIFTNPSIKDMALEEFTSPGTYFFNFMSHVKEYISDFTEEQKNANMHFTFLRIFMDAFSALDDNISFEEFQKLLLIKVKKFIDANNINLSNDATVDDCMELYKKHVIDPMKKNIEDYVNGTIEVTTSGTSKILKDNELMIYSPNGFYLKRDNNNTDLEDHDTEDASKYF